MQARTWTRVFRIVWRINGIALLVLLVLAILGISSSLLSGLFRNSRPNALNQANLAPPVEGKPELRLGSFERVHATSVLRADLRSPDKDSFSSYKGGSSTSHNVLFIDTNDGKSWWLLPNSDLVIRSEQTVSLPGEGIDKPLAKIFHLVNEEDIKSSSLVLADLKGLKQTTISTGEIRLDEVVAFSGNDAKVIYHDANGYHIITVNPSDVTKVRESPISFKFPPRKQR
ncbi:MAG: hypothetical protein HY823_14010 [Acidobacteria bacterium]|nr:hypothetical protein [Acidobacteriota bacterium]